MPNESENELMSRMRSVKSKREPSPEEDGNWIQDESEIDRRFDAEEIVKAVKKPDPLVGKVLFGTYKIEKVLGEGAMGIVYKAKQLAFDRYVAMKTIKSTDSELTNRFAQEVKVHAQLKHDNIVEAIDCLIAPNGQVFFVMELLEGIELEELVKTKELSDKPLDLADVVIQILDALDAAHQKGIIHRDLKPGNVVLQERDGKLAVKVVDFGIAKLQEDMQRLTKTGQALGSPLYMSPEQCMGKDVDGRSDLYSLGILIYELLTGDFPFIGKDMAETMSLHCDPSKLPPPVSSILPDLPCVNQLDQILLKALSTYPRNRYQDCAEFKKAIQFWVKSISENTPTLNVPGTSRRIGKATSVPLEEREAEIDESFSKSSSISRKTSAKPIKQPGMPEKGTSKKSTYVPAIIAGIVLGLILVVFILVTALILMKERVNDLKAIPREIQKQQEPDSNLNDKKKEVAPQATIEPPSETKVKEQNSKPANSKPAAKERARQPAAKAVRQAKPVVKPKPVVPAKPKPKKPAQKNSGNPFDDLRNMKE